MRAGHVHGNSGKDWPRPSSTGTALPRKLAARPKPRQCACTRRFDDFINEFEKGLRRFPQESGIAEFQPNRGVDTSRFA
jgi:hypothetical protein